VNFFFKLHVLNIENRFQLIILVYSGHNVVRLVGLECALILQRGPINNVALYFCSCIRHLLIDFRKFFYWHTLDNLH